MFMHKDYQTVAFGLSGIAVIGPRCCLNGADFHGKQKAAAAPSCSEFLVLPVVADLSTAAARSGRYVP